MTMMNPFFRLLFPLFLVATTTTAQGNSFQCQSDADCLNRGKCLLTGSCQCPDLFGGKDCSAHCPRKCQNGGSCRFHEDISHGSDQDGNTYCDCLDNFLGVNCEIPFVTCAGSALKCLHGGTCLQSEGCQCPSPRTGDQCQYESPQDPRIPAFQCQTNADCLNAGECIQVSNQDNYCRCPPGFGGQHCASNCDRGCQNGGSCRFHQDISHGSDQEGNAYCECPPNFLGVNCEIPYVSCPYPGRQELKCLHGGTCRASMDEGVACQCPPGRTGEVCQYQATHQEQQQASDRTNWKTPLLLLAAAFGGAAFLTAVVVFSCRGNKTTLLETKNETQISSLDSNNEVC